MELKLAANVKHLRVLSLSVDKHMIKLEGRKIFHELNSRNYLSALVGGYDPDNTERVYIRLSSATDEY